MSKKKMNFFWLILIIMVLITTPIGAKIILDTGFDSDGLVVHDNAADWNGYDEGKAITIDTNGKILVVGSSQSGGPNYDMVIWRYNSDGSLDTNFGSNGWVVHNSAVKYSLDLGRAITIDADGKILVAGSGYSAAGGPDMVIWRYNSDGSLDTSFDSDGLVMHHNAAGGNGVDKGYAIITDADGKILVAGCSRNPSDNNDMVIWRYNSDGSLDTSFGTNSNGLVVHNNAAGGNGDDEGNAITIDANGKILVVGYSDRGGES